jgi:integrase
MSRTITNPRITNRTGRAKLASRRDPYWHLIAEGQHLGYRRGARGGTWIARLYDPALGRRYQSVGVSDDTVEADGITVFSFQQAQEKARDWFKQLAHGTPERSGPYWLAQAMEDYVTDRERMKRKPLQRTRTSIRAHILSTLGDVDLSKLTHAKLKAWRDALQEGAPRVRTKAGKQQAFREFDGTNENAKRARQATANRVLTTLKAALNYALESRRVSSNAAWISVKPFRNVDVPKVRFLTPAEANSLVDASALDFRLLIQAALLTGCRYGELTAMEASAFDRNSKSIFIPKSKNGEARHVLLNQEGARFFDQLTNGKTPQERMFLRSDGRAWKDSEQKRPMDAACAGASLEQVTFHILRHTYASQLAMNGAPMKFIADQLGHKSTRITERHYAHLGDDYKRQTIQRTLPDFGFAVARELYVEPRHHAMHRQFREGHSLTLVRDSRGSA